MTEAFLQYIWKHKLFDHNQLITTDGQVVKVISTGLQNTDAGPDFFDARLEIGSTLWAGNVEVHVNASDWESHGHHNDKAYNNVILHVVANADKEIVQLSGEEISTAELPFEKKLEENYTALLSSEKWVACETGISDVDAFTKRFWLGQLTIRRLERKTKAIELILKRNTNSWEETFYQQLLRSFGFSVNSEPFEQLAISLPQAILAKNKHSLLSIEALLFGQAGFLEQSAPVEDQYFDELKKEYLFLKAKYNLKPLPSHLWKFMRLRPVNFPTVRIAQLASLIHNSKQLFSKVKEAQEVTQVRDLFVVEPSIYWQTHYYFFKHSAHKSKAIGKVALDSVLINTVVPILFAYGKYIDEQKVRDKALQFWEAIQAEENSTIRNWKNLGMKPENAADSQALLELKKEFCDSKKCLICPIGNKLVNR